MAMPFRFIKNVYYVNKGHTTAVFALKGRKRHKLYYGIYR